MTAIHKTKLAAYSSAWVATAAKFACVASGGPTQQNQRVFAPDQRHA
jgi:hypothetical protein